jgi:SOS-response transcriptional repressor LexA
LTETLTDLIYKFIVDYQKTHGGVPPTYKQIGEFAGISYKGPTSRHIRKLKEAGLVESDESNRAYAVGGAWVTPKQVKALSKAITGTNDSLPEEAWKILLDIASKTPLSQARPESPGSTSG